MKSTPRQRKLRFVLALLLLAAVGWLWAGTLRDPHFWLTADQQGDRLLRHQEFAAAAEAYADPWRIGVAQYRDGDFEAAARTFGRVPGYIGAFNQGNAWLLCGKYDEAIASYDRALRFWPGWIETVENRDLALARKALVEAAGEKAAKESAEAYHPDKRVFDRKASGKKGKPQELGEPARSNEQQRAAWLPRIQAMPGDFLRAKFAYSGLRVRARFHP